MAKDEQSPVSARGTPKGDRLTFNGQSWVAMEDYDLILNQLESLRSENASARAVVAATGDDDLEHLRRVMLEKWPQNMTMQAKINELIDWKIRSMNASAAQDAIKGSGYANAVNVTDKP